MSIAQDLLYKLDLSRGTQVVNLTTPLVEGDKEAHTFHFELLDGGEVPNLSSVSCAGYFARHATKDHQADTIPVIGSVTGNTVAITLSESCYSRSTYFTFVVRLTDLSTGQKRSIAIIRGMVVNSADGDIVDPDGSIPSLDELFAQIAAMEQATAAAEAVVLEYNDKVAEQDASIAALTQEIERNTAPPIIPTATGSIVTITDGAARPAVEVISHIEPVETGTGEKGPNNPWTISGWDKVTAKQTGRNMVKPSFDTVTTDGITFTAHNDGSVTITGTAGSTVGQRISDNTMDVFLKQGHNYHFFLADSAPNAGITLQVYIDGQSKLNSQNAYLTIPETATSAYIRIRVAAGAEINETIHPMVTLDDDATWETGSAQILTADLPETVYGGKLNWTTGVLTNKYARIVFDGVTDGRKFNSSDSSTGESAYISKRYLPAEGKPGNLAYSNMTTSLRIANAGPIIVGLPPSLTGASASDDSTTVTSKFNAACAALYAAGTPLEIVYEIATPEEIQLTPYQLSTLKGINNVWSSTGDTTLSYVADTEAWGKEAATSMIGAVESGMTATRNYSIGDFIVSREALSLYRTTAAIAKGETIKPGTNCTPTTVAEQLAALYTLLDS